MACSLMTQSGGYPRLGWDVLNVFDSDARLQEGDLTDAKFFLFLPVATQPPRYIRIGLRYELKILAEENK